MANVNLLNPTVANNALVNQSRVAEAAQPVREGRADGEAQGRIRPEDEENREELLSNVIATSRDGDTVQASEEAVRESQEEEDRNRDAFSRMIRDPENARLQVQNGSESRQELQQLELERSREIREALLEEQQAEATERREQAREAEPNAVLADEEATIAEEGQINSFIGYTDAELERMVLQGDITQFDYNQEMESREAEREERQEEVADFALENTQNASRIEADERQIRAIEQAFSDEANERIDAADRAQILQAMQRIEEPQRQAAANNDPNQVPNIALG